MMTRSQPGPMSGLPYKLDFRTVTRSPLPAGLGEPDSRSHQRNDRPGHELLMASSSSHTPRSASGPRRLASKEATGDHLGASSHFEIGGPPAKRTKTSSRPSRPLADPESYAEARQKGVCSECRARHRRCPPEHRERSRPKKPQTLLDRVSQDHSGHDMEQLDAGPPP